jgi:phosphatidylserine/phosphatidylglycerophosphate/cardiolipin synthase-like enzyme
MLIDLPTPPAVSAASAAAVCADTLPDVHFGGPDLPEGALKAELKARIEATPAGGSIDWATYYLRDRELVDALIAAHARGVKVRVVLEANPKQRDANVAVIARLRAGIGDGVKAYAPRSPFAFGHHLHLKIYAFSGPCPAAFVGSYNPIGDDPGDERVMAAVGDQDRGHNVLVELKDPRLVDGLKDHVGSLWRGEVRRSSAEQNAPIVAGPTTIYLYPRVRSDMLEDAIASLKPEDRIIGAVSHMDAGPISREMQDAARSGVEIQLVVNGSKRRVSKKAVNPLRKLGAEIERFRGGAAIPMHAKFLLMKRTDRTEAWFGSFNLNRGSRRRNHEVLIRSSDPRIVESLTSRYRVIARQIADAGKAPTPAPALLQKTSAVPGG